MNCTNIKQLTSLFTFLLLTIGLSNCSKDKNNEICSGDVLGTYQGSLESDLGFNNDEVLWIHDSNSEIENEVSISGYFGTHTANASIKAFTGIVSMDCQRIEIAEQQLITSSAWVSGSLTISNNQLNGTLIYRAREYNFNLNKLN